MGNPTRQSRFGVHIATLALAFAGLAVLASPALAAPPTDPEFFAPECQGQTDSDPRNASAADHQGETDLTRVFGERLASYNDGNVVPLYDSYGWASQSYPALCGTFYDPVIDGPRSEWMWCTDVRAKVCGDIGPNGSLNEGAVVEGPMGERPSNPKLNEDQKRIIEWLLRNGHSYIPQPGEPATLIADQSTSERRFAMQNLIWCVSDPGHAPLVTMCNQNLPAAEWTRILDLTTPSIEPTLTLSGAQTELAVGGARRITLRSTVRDRDIVLNTTGAGAGTIRVCGGAATLTGNRLRIAASTSAQPSTITLCVRTSRPGSFELKATVTTGDAGLDWAQSGSVCQVFVRPQGPKMLAAKRTWKITKTQPKVQVANTYRTRTAGTSARLTLRVSGLLAGHGAQGRAVLYGPSSRVNGRACRSGRALASVRFTPRNGRLRTPAVRDLRPGRYTWVVRISEDSHNNAAASRCGEVRGSFVVRKRSYRLTTVATGHQGPSRGAARRPAARISMPALGVSAPLLPVGLRGTAMQVPSNAAVAGLLSVSAGLNDAIGTTVVAGHVSDRRDSPGAMYRLAQARVGQRLSVTVGAKTVRYRVVKVERFDRSKPLPARLAKTGGPHRLVVISCTNKVTRNGRWHYTDNVVVTAVPL